MVTYRAPGVNEAPAGTPDQTKFAELGMFLLSRRWASSLAKAESDIRSPLNSDRFPLIGQFRVRPAAAGEKKEPHKKRRKLTENEKEECNEAVKKAM
eukprot:14317001-Alexandrium_andersonii.AAC.1